MACCCCSDGPVNALLRLYCKTRCNGKLVAAALSFHPPTPPFYNFVPITTQQQQKNGRSKTDDNDNDNDNNDTIYNTLLRHSMIFDECVIMADIVPEVYLLPCPKNNTHLAVAIYTHPAPTFVLLYSHGNATDIGAMHPHLVLLSQLCKLTVICYDYDGYGCSTGSPSEQGAYNNIECVYNFLLERQIVTNPTKELVCYGESIGSGPSVWLCSKNKVAGMILHSAIASGLRVLTENRLLCCCDIFPNLSRIQHVKCSTFVIHGKCDEQVLLSHGKRLYAALPSNCQYTPWWVEHAGHNNIRQLANEQYMTKVNWFLEHLGAVSPENHDRIVAGLTQGPSSTDERSGEKKQKEQEGTGTEAGSSVTAASADRKRSAVVYPEVVLSDVNEIGLPKDNIEGTKVR